MCSREQWCKRKDSARLTFLSNNIKWSEILNLDLGRKKNHPNFAKGEKAKCMGI